MLWMRRAAAKVLIAAMLLTVASIAAAQAQSEDDLAALNKQIDLLFGQGKYPEATAVVQQALTLAERLRGVEHPDMLIYINNLAELYRFQGRYAEAEPLYLRALQVGERVLGKEHPNTLLSINNLGQLYYNQARYREAEPLLKRALGARERVLGKDHRDTLLSANCLALLYNAQGRLGEAEQLYRRALEVTERVLGREDALTLATINNLAELYRDQGRYGEAEQLYKRVVEAAERTLGKEHPVTLSSANNLAETYRTQGRYAEAEPLYKRTLEAAERVLGKEHPDTLSVVNNLAMLYRAQGRYDEAEPLYKRVLETAERVLGKAHPFTLGGVNNLAFLYVTQERYGDAELLYKRALETSERALGKEHPFTLTIVNNLAMAYDAQDRQAEAEPLYKHALETRERLLGKDHPDTLSVVNNLAELYRTQGRFDVAERFHKRALEAAERVLGKDHPHVGASLNNLAILYFVQSDWRHAAQYWRRSTDVTIQRTLRGSQEVGQAPTGKRKRETERLSFQFWGLVKAAYRVASDGHTTETGAAREMFETAQWALDSEAAQSLAQMAARGAKGDPKLATIVRERQDLVVEWQRRDTLHNAALAQAPDRRDTATEAANMSRLTAIDARITEIDKRLSTEFPEYTALASPTPLSVQEVQATLGADEALVLFLDTDSRFYPAPEETFIWVVTKTDMRWVRSELGTPALTREVQALRCGLDAAAWSGPRCAEITGQSYSEADGDAGKPLPFDHIRAHKFYQALFGQVEDLIKGKQLLLVPSGPLTQLPFQVLVTAPPANGGNNSVAWLARSHALTVLPAVSSLKALRRVAHSNTATKPMIGFGNPLLDGNQADPQFGAYFKRQAQLAQDKQRCPKTPLQHVAAFFRLRGVMPLETRGGLAQLLLIRKQVPLPETADELCAVARDLHVDPDEVHLGARATELDVKRLSAGGRLAQYRVVHFATHAALAGELKGASEPGLILTPPETATEEDDGYLSASEIASLKLDADWVILSACNTAAGDASGAQALSGLARAFIYAQARTLLVSHWAVDSNAAVKLITSAIGEMVRDRSVGRAEALRRAMLALIDKGSERESHPAYWAPFIVVGEGAL